MTNLLEQTMHILTVSRIKTMHLFKIKHHISNLVVTTSVASLLMTVMSQVQVKAANLIYNYSGQDYTFSQVDEVGTSANLTSQFWYGNPTEADNVASFIQINYYYLTTGTFVKPSYIAYGTTTSYGIPSNLVTTASINGGFGSGNQFSADRSLTNTYLIATPTNSTSVPEPFTIIGTLIGGTAAFRIRKKLQTPAE
jgi:hypothetical protein